MPVVTHEGGRRVGGDDRLALDLKKLDLSGDDDDIDAGYRAWRQGGSTERARDSREAVAEEVERGLPSLRMRLRRGLFGVGMPRPTTVKGGRLVGALGVIETIVVAALIAPFHRHPALGQILPCSFAYAPSRRGAGLLVSTFLREVRQAAACGAVEVGAADIKSCFPSLSPFRALAHARDLGFAAWRCDRLEQLYRWWNTVPEFRGLTPGPSSSCFLSEVALRPLDLLLAAASMVFRYSDNIYLIGCGVPVRELLHQTLATFNEQEHLNLSLHHEQVTTYSAAKGFSDEFEALGFLFRGHEVVPHPTRVERCRKKVIAAKSVEKAENIIEGFTSYFAAAVPRGVLVRLEKKLWSARREPSRARVNP